MPRPRLLVFAPCERVVIAQEDNTASVIGLLPGFDIAVAPPAEQVIKAPVTWYVFTLWESVNEDPSRYKQRFELLGPAPEQRVLMSATAPVISKSEPNKLFHRTASRIVGFPISGIGDHTIRLSMQEGDGDFTEESTFPIPVNLANR